VPGAFEVAVAGTSVIAVAYGFARYGFGLFVPVFQAEFGLSSTAIGAISSAAYLAYLTALLTAGGLTARYGPRLPVVLGAGSAAVGMLLVASASNPALLIVGVVVAATSPGLCWAPFSDAVGAQVRAELRGRVLAVVSTGTTFGLVVTGPIVLLTSSGGGNWRWAWAGFAAAAMGSGAWNAWLLPSRPLHPAARPAPPHGARSTNATARRRTRLAWVRRAGAGALLGQAGSYGLVAATFFTFAVDLVSRAGLPGTSRALLLTLVGLGGLTGLLTGDLVRRLGLGRCLPVSLVLLAGAVAGLALGSAVPVAAGAAALLFGAAYMPLAALLMLWSAEVYPERPSSGFTVVLCALAAGSIVGPALLGAVADATDLPTAFLLLAAITLTSVMLRPAAQRDH
jgi:predicted MFS family arabinose efflux permease